MSEGMRVFTPDELAERLKVNVHTIYRHIRSGKLPASKPGGAYIVSRADLVIYLGSSERVDSIFGSEH